MTLPLLRWVHSIYALLIIAVLLPLTTFACITLIVSLHKEREVTELKEQIKIAEVFTAVPVFDPPVNIDTIATRVDRVLEYQPLYLSISLFDEHLKRIYSSSPHPDDPIAPESVREAVLSGKPVVGAISHGPNRLRKKSVGGASSPIRRLLPLRNPLI